MAFDLASWLSGKPTQVQDANGGIAGEWGDGQNGFMKKILGMLQGASGLNDDAGRQFLAQQPTTPAGQPGTMPQTNIAPHQAANMGGAPPYNSVNAAKGEAHGLWQKAFGMPNPLGKVEYKEQTPNGGTWSFKMDPTDSFLKMNNHYKKLKNNT